MNACIALSVLFLLGLPLDARADADKPVYKIFLCDVYKQPSTTLVFRSGENRGRYITFMESYREFAIRVPHDEEFVKGLLSWDKVVAVRTLPTDVPGMAGHLRIDFRLDGRDRVLELGAIDKPCLTALKKRYASHLSFQPN